MTFSRFRLLEGDQQLRTDVMKAITFSLEFSKNKRTITSDGCFCAIGKVKLTVHEEVRLQHEIHELPGEVVQPRHAHGVEAGAAQVVAVVGVVGVLGQVVHEVLQGHVQIFGYPVYAVGESTVGEADGGGEDGGGGQQTGQIRARPVVVGAGGGPLA